MEKIAFYVFDDTKLSFDKDDNSKPYYDDVCKNLNYTDRPDLIADIISTDKPELFMKMLSRLVSGYEGSVVSIYCDDRLIYGGVCDDTILELDIDDFITV